MKANPARRTIKTLRLIESIDGWKDDPFLTRWHREVRKHAPRRLRHRPTKTTPAKGKMMTLAEDAGFTVKTLRTIESIEGWHNDPFFRRWHAELAKRADAIIDRSIQRAIESRETPAGGGLVAKYATISGKPPEERPSFGGIRRIETIYPDAA